MITKKITKKEMKNMAAELGRLGGRKVVKNKGKAYMRKIGKLGAKKRWASVSIKKSKLLIS